MVAVAGSTSQTAALDPAAVNAVHGNAIWAVDFSFAVPATALPSVIAEGGFSRATLTRTVRVFGSTAGDTSRTWPTAAMSRFATSATETGPPSMSRKNIDSLTSN